MIVRPDGPLLFALTLRQPIASEVASGERAGIIRPLSTHYRGDVLITAASYQGEGPRGCTLCVVDIYDVTETPGDFVWCVRNVRAVPQLPVRGRPGLWEVSAVLLKQLGLRVAVAEAKKGREPTI